MTSFSVITLIPIHCFIAGNLSIPLFFSELPSTHNLFSLDKRFFIFFSNIGNKRRKTPMKQINLTGGWKKLYKKEDQKLEKKSQQYYFYSECRSCFSFFVKIYLLFFRRKKKKKTWLPPLQLLVEPKTNNQPQYIYLIMITFLILCKIHNYCVFVRIEDSMLSFD